MLKNKKNIFVFLLFLILILIFVMVYISLNYNNHPKKRELITVLTPLKCDLNKKGLCSISKNGKNVIFKISKHPVEAMEEFNLTIENLTDCKDLSVRIYGLNMYMGTLVPQLNKIKNGCKGAVVLSTCSLKTMRFRFELFKNEKSLGFYSDMDIKR